MSERSKSPKVEGFSATPAEQRLLHALFRPITVQEAASMLGVTRQRIHQLVERLLEKSRVKISDRTGLNVFIARCDDPTLLLNSMQARALSSLVPGERSLTSSVAAVLRRDEQQVELILLEIERLCLIERLDHFSGRMTWSLTDQGREHPQRRAVGRLAKGAPIGIKSDRSINVLSILANDGPTRGKDLSERLKLDKFSMNAFIQYLKRKGWIRKTGSDLTDPYELTEIGLQVLDGLKDQDT